VAGVLLVAGCGGSGSASPEPTASATSQPPAAATQAVAPSPTPAGVAIDAPAGPGPQPGAPCPVAEVLCEFAVELETAIEAGDADALLAMSRPVTAKCSGQTPASKGLCEGAGPEETRQGYWVIQGNQALVVSETELRGGLAPWFDAIARHNQTPDVYGPGELRIGSISCTRRPEQESGTCLGISVQVHFTFINPEQVQTTGAAGKRITFHVSASVQDGEPKLNGFGTVDPPNSALLPGRIDIQDAAGNPLIAEVYPWTQ
jgi:hypothetical protein